MTPDRISNLPLSIIHTILTLMPIRDAFRTSILCRKWRYYCSNIPKLKFDDYLRKRSSDMVTDKWIFRAIYNVLLLHHDPVLEFSLRVSDLESSVEIDWIILYLSRNTLQKFTLDIRSDYEYMLPSAFFSLKKLTHLKLYSCEIPALTSSCGFSMLTNLLFDSVNITMTTLPKFLRCCPLLKSLSLINPFGIWYSNFFEIFECLPLIEYLHIGDTFDEPFRFGFTLPRQLPNMLVHLRVLKLDNLSFFQEDELHFALLLVTSSPNLEKINLEMDLSPRETSQIAINPFDLHDFSNVILNNLLEMEITCFCNNKPEMDFVKFILSNSPMLKTLRIEINHWTSVGDEVKILKDLLLIPRASIGAKIKFERPCYH